MIVTSSDVIFDGVNRVFDWFKEGFSGTLPGAMDKEDWEKLHHNLKLVEDKGVAVKFWKVQQNSSSMLRGWHGIDCRHG